LRNSPLAHAAYQLGRSCRIAVYIDLGVLDAVAYICTFMRSFYSGFRCYYQEE
jgi:hypothetical protein